MRPGGGFKVKKAVFLDARLIFDLLEGVMTAPSLLEAAEAKLPPCKDPIQIDDGLFCFLTDEEFLKLHAPLRDAVDHYGEVRARAAQSRAQIAALHRKLTQVEAALSASQRAKLTGIFKSKQQVWDEGVERSRLEAKREELRLTCERAEGDVEKAGLLYRDLLERIYRTSGISEVRFYRGLPLELTHHGIFLLDYLSEMNPEHFQGRALPEILEIGGALA